MKKFVLFMMISVALLGCANSHDGTALPDETLLRGIVQAKMDEYGVPGIQVCVKDSSGDETIKFSLGYSNMENATPLSNSTRIKVGSNTKSFTAIGILILAQNGLIDLDDEIGAYLDIQGERYKRVTIRQLMNMHSGLRGYINDDGDDYIVDKAIADPSYIFPPEELIRYAFEVTEAQGMTGENEYHYTNTNYVLLGMIIEQVSGVSYSDFVRREITEPLGLRSTYIPVDNKYGDNVSSGYNFDRTENTTTDYSSLDMSYVWSAGAVISTASDLCDWMLLLGTDKVVSGDMAIYVRSGLTVGEGIQYTSGLINEPEKLWHNGTVLGYHGEMCYLKSSGVAIAVLSNCTIAGVDGDPVKEIMDEIITLINE